MPDLRTDPYRVPTTRRVSSRGGAAPVTPASSITTLGSPGAHWSARWTREAEQLS